MAEKLLTRNWDKPHSHTLETYLASGDMASALRSAW